MVLSSFETETVLNNGRRSVCFLYNTSERREMLQDPQKDFYIVSFSSAGMKSIARRVL